jgi:pyruvate/2-oxoglutarate dehydrogenase complex dihydrolipoamide dehydrogenase (E3) component
MVTEAGKFGVEVEGACFDWETAKKRKDKVVEKLLQKKEETIKKWGIDFYPFKARFLSSNKVLVGGEEIEAKKFIIATGSKVATPPIEGIEECITSDTAFDLPSLPSSLIILGGGAVAIEFSYIFSMAGVRVSLVEARERLLYVEDAEVSEGLKEVLNKYGVDVYLGARVSKVEKGNSGYRVRFLREGREKTLEAEMVMNALGRKPNLDGLELGETKVSVEMKAVKVDEFLKTEESHIYAAGDSIGGYMFTSVAYYEGQLAAKNAIERDVRGVDYSVVPRATFFHPQVGSVGVTEEQIVGKGLHYVVGRYPYSGAGAAICDDIKEGMAKIIVEKPGGRILGAHVFGENASELIQVVSMAMQARATVHELARHLYIHPTLSEVIGEAAIQAVQKLKS